MRVLVTGATGFIGRQLVSRLRDAGAEVTGLAVDAGNDSRLPTSPNAGTEPELDGLRVDLSQAGATFRALTTCRPDRVIHLAAAGVADPAIDPQIAVQHNVSGTLNLLRACFDNPDLKQWPGQLIVIRTPGESEPANAYVASKAAAWSFCQMHARRDGWPIAGIMIFQAYGPGQPQHTFVQAAFRSALGGKDFAMTSGEQLRDWIYLSDVVEGLVAALTADLAPGDTIDLGTGKLTSLLDVARMAYRIAGRGGRPLPGAIPDRPGEYTDRVAAISRSEEVLGWTPQINLEDGLLLVLESLVR